MEELALKESEVNDKGVVQIAGEDSKEKSQEPTKQTEKQKKKRLNKNEISQTKLTKFFKINKDWIKFFCRLSKKSQNVTILSGTILNLDCICLDI